MHHDRRWSGVQVFRLSTSHQFISVWSSVSPSSPLNWPQLSAGNMLPEEYVHVDSSVLPWCVVIAPTYEYETMFSNLPNKNQILQGFLLSLRHHWLINDKSRLLLILVLNSEVPRLHVPCTQKWWTVWRVSLNQCSSRFISPRAKTALWESSKGHLKDNTNHSGRIKRLINATWIFWWLEVLHGNELFPRPLCFPRRLQRRKRSNWSCILQMTSNPTQIDRRVIKRTNLLATSSLSGYLFGALFYCKFMFHGVCGPSEISIFLDNISDLSFFRVNKTRTERFGLFFKVFFLSWSYFK